MKTVHCSVCDRDVPAVNQGYRVVGIVKRDGWWVNVYVCKECGNAGSVSLELAAQPEMVTVASTDNAMARDAVVLSAGMARLL
jgi:hypothetical protein